LRALVISDTHFGAWTGRDLLREELFLERLAPQLEGLDELIFLGDLYDFLFGSLGEAVDASGGLLELMAARLGGKRLVFLAGNHDHHLVHRDAENRLEAELAAGAVPGEEASPPVEPPGPAFFQAFLERRLPGIEVEIAYPTYSFAGVLCTHGHYLDPHARMSGSRGSRLLTRALWAIAAGGPEQPTCIEDYESITTLLTEWLYVAAQMPHGTHAQQNVFRAAQRAARLGSTLALPVRGAHRLAEELRSRGVGSGQNGNVPLPSSEHFDAVVRDEAARQNREQPLVGPAFSRPLYPEPTVISRSDPAEHALEAFAEVVANLGWDREAEQIVFAHTHQPLADVRSARGGPTRYWNTGCWIYEPDLGSRAAYARYLRYAWPGTAVVIDDEEPCPRLVETLADLNPLNGGPGLPAAP
jgi:UDP-2,3-diacylglucosamine pyrophosphatase LpxH